MCKKGNHAIFSACRDAIRETLGRDNISNQEMQKALKLLGVNGCMMPQKAPTPVDKELVPTI